MMGPVCFAGDAGSFLVRLSKGLKGHRCPEDWPQSLKAGDVSKENANRYNSSSEGSGTQQRTTSPSGASVKNA